MKRLLLALVLALGFAGTAHAACNVPNPNLNGPPFVDNCPLPAAALNNLIQGTRPEAFGAIGNGTADDTTALNNAAAAAAGGRLILGNKTYRAASTVIIPDNTDVEGTFISNGPNPRGTIIQCDLAVTPCVKVGSATNAGGTFNGVSITRAAGTIPAAAVCVQFNGNANEFYTNSECFRHGIGVQLTSIGTSGIYFYAHNITTCAIATHHVEVNALPGVYFSDSTFGCNGGSDLPATSYVHIIGNWDSTKGTVHFTDVQMNQGVNTVNCGVAFDSFTGITNAFFDLEIVGGHVETVNHLMCSDSSVLSLQIIQLNGLWSAGLQSALTLNAATQLAFWDVTGSTFTNFTDFTAAPTPASGFSVFNWVGNNFQQAVHFTGSSGSTINMKGNIHNGNVILDGLWGGGTFDSTFVAGSFTSPSASAMLNLNITLPPTAATCALQLGGASTGITYSGGTPTCSYTLSNHTLTYSYQILLTSNGSATGAATITGLPFGSSSNISALAPINAQNMASATNGIYAFVNSAGTKTVALTTFSATGLVNATNTNFTATSALSGTVSYPVGAN